MKNGGSLRILLLIFIFIAFDLKGCEAFVRQVSPPARSVTPNADSVRGKQPFFSTQGDEDGSFGFEDLFKKPQVSSRTIDRHEELFGLINIFGRLAERYRVIDGPDGAVDVDPRFSCGLPLNTGSEKRPANWATVLFNQRDQITRKEFKDALRSASFKYPAGERGPVVPPQLLVQLAPGVSLAGLEEGEEAAAAAAAARGAGGRRGPPPAGRGRAEALFSAAQLPEELLDRTFTRCIQKPEINYIYTMEDFDDNDTLDKDHFSSVLCAWNEAYSSFDESNSKRESFQNLNGALIHWEVFLDNLFMLEKFVPNRGSGYAQ